QAQIARSAERLARDHGHLGLLQDEFGQLGGGLWGLSPDLLAEQVPDRRVGVERSLWLGTDHTGDLVEHANDGPAPTVEGLTHLPDGGQVTGNGGQSGGLGDIGHIRGRVRLQVARGLDHVLRADDPSHTPTGHRVRLGDTVDDDRAVGDLGNLDREGGELGVAVDQVFVDLVGEYPQTVLVGPLPDGTDLFTWVHGAGRVVRGHEHQGLGAFGACGLQLFDTCQIAGALVGDHEDRDTARELDRLGVGRPVRGDDDDLVTRVEHRGEGFVDGLLAAVGDQDLARLHLVTGVPGGLLDDGLLQFRQAGRGGVAVEARLAGSLDSGLDDGVGGRKVRLSGAEADHGAALRLHGLGLGVDGEGGGLGDGTDACGDTWSVSHGSMVSCVVP